MLAKQLSQQLALSAEDVACHLFPNGKKHGKEYCVGNIHGDDGDSLKIHLTGVKAGIWCDFASGERGDLLDLWALKRGISIVEAMKEVSSYLGIAYRQITPVSLPKYVKPKNSVIPDLMPNHEGLDYLLNERCLTQETLTAFKISIVNDEIVFPYYRDEELIFIKYLKIARINNKKQIRVEANCEPCLFGWHLIGNSRKVVICEGEIDAMTLHQYGFPALSVPFGGGTGSKHVWIENDFERLSAFDQIYLCLDNDAEGKSATIELSERLGRHRCKVVELPMKDANECLTNGLDKEGIKYYFKEAITLDPEGLRGAESFEDEFIKELFYPDASKKGYESPWKKSREEIVFRPNELSIWTGTNGHGKSQFLGQIILGLMAQGARVCIASLELRPFKFIKRLTIQATAMRNFSEDFARETLRWYGGKLWLVSLYSKDKAKTVLDIFDYAHQRYGIDVFVIDPFAKMGIAQDDYKKQTDFIEELCDFKEKHSCQIHLIVHPRKGEDEFSAPGKLDIKGTGTITDLADNCFTVWRNKAKEIIKRKNREGISLSDKEIEKLRTPDVVWHCDKQRDEDGAEGAFGFWFDNDALQYLEGEYDKPKRIINYSCLKPTD